MSRAECRTAVYHSVMQAKPAFPHRFVSHTSYLIALALGFLVIAFAYAVPFVSHAAESIPSFDARITVSEDATVEVAEAIVYDFGSAPDRHGIFRTIPYSYQAGTETYTADISSVTVTDAQGRAWPFVESRENGELTIKIGDPQKTVTGKQSYVLSYIVKGPFLYFEDRDEFYWNVTGSWPASIERASVLIDLPYGAQVLDASCYQGAVGGHAECASEERLQNADRAGYTAQAYKLAQNQGMSVAVAFPKGTITIVEKPWSGEEGGFPYMLIVFSALVPLVTFAAMLYLWYTRGRDPKGRGTIVAEYEPPESVGPALAGVLYDERVDMRDISAEIIALAVTGHIRIHRFETTTLLILTETDYLFERLTDAERTKEPLSPIGALLIEKLFEPEFSGTYELDGVTVSGALLSKMKHTWVKQKEAVVARIYDEVVVLGYFSHAPQKVRVRYALAGVVVVILGFFVMSLVGVGLIISGAIIAAFAYFMPAKTAAGVILHEEVEGFRRYLSVAEKDRLEFHNAPENMGMPEKTAELFDRFLPYAIALKVEDKWAEQFSDLALTRRDWYTGSPGSMFTAAAFASDLGHFTTDFAAASAPQSSGSSGGGSVGGGFGGGGGGSW